MRRRVRWLLLGGAVSLPLLIVLARLVSVSAQERRQNISPNSAQLEMAMREEDKSYRIGPGDLLEIHIFNRPEMEREVRVDAAGHIRLPFIGEITAACLTENQLAREIAERYKKYLRDPQVDVFIKEYNSQPVSVMGAVNKPGRFQLQRRVRLLELLSFAGGPSEKAGQTIHIIHSGEPHLCAEAGVKTGGDEAARPLLTTLQLRDLLSGNPAANLYLEPGDIVSLPEADQVFVTGSVAKPGPYPMSNKITLTQAIAMAGGFAQDANRKRVRLIRQEPGKEVKVETVYNVEEIEKHRAEDLLLQASDVIDVPSSTGQTTRRGILAALAQSAGLLPLYMVLR